MKIFSALCIAVLLGMGAYAAEDAAPPSDFAKVQAALKQRAPEEYAKIEKLAATDLNAALREFRELARKRDLKLPRPGGRNRRGPDGGDRPMHGGHPGRGDRQMRGGGPLETLILDAKLRKRFPEEFAAAVRELIAAEDKLNQLAERGGVKYPPNFISQLRRLRDRAPEKFAAIESKAATEPREGLRELVELAREQGIELGMPTMRGRRGGRGGPEGRGGDFTGEKPAPRKLSTPPLRKLREKFPEEMRRYESLRQEDPAAAAKLLRELAERLKNEKGK